MAARRLERDGSPTGYRLNDGLTAEVKLEVLDFRAGADQGFRRGARAMIASNSVRSDGFTT